MLRLVVQVAAVMALLMPGLMAAELTAAEPPSQAGFPGRVLDAVTALDKTDYFRSPDSGTLAWAESYVLTAYYWMYEATGDRAWLDRIVRRADAIFANISTRDGRHPGWRTPTYSVALVEAGAAPGNASAAAVRPDPPRVLDHDTAAKVSGHAYRLVATAAGAVEITDTTTGEQLGASELPADGRITSIPGAAVVITGKPAPGDRFRVTTQALKPIEYVVHDGMILTPIAQFCAAVLGDDMGAPSMGGPSVEGPRNPRGLQDRAPIAREDLARSAEPAPSLHSGQALSLSKGPRALQARYGSAARRYLRVMETQLLPKWEPYWRDVAEGGGVYVAQDDPAQRFPGATLPHNQYLALGRTYIALYRSTGKPLYRERAERMARFFKSKLRLVDDHYEWNYWDAAGTWDDAEARRMQHIEDSSHGAIDVGFAVDAYDAGIVFDREDMQRLARTVSQAMWNHDYGRPRLGRVVNSVEGDTTNALEWVRLGRFSTRTRHIMVGLLQSLEVLGLAEAEAGAQELTMERRRWMGLSRLSAGKPGLYPRAGDSPRGDSPSANRSEAP